MKKLVFALLSFIVIQTGLNASTFDFKSYGDSLSNPILEEYVQKYLEGFRGDVVSYYYDIDNDGVFEIIGIVKSNLFYNSQGYELVVLKNKDGSWHNINTDIYFDISKKIEINGRTVSYYKSSLKQGRLLEGRIPNRLSEGFRQLTHNKNIKNAHLVTEGVSGREYDVSSFSGSPQKAVKIQYENLSDRTRHYLEMK